MRPLLFLIFATISFASNSFAGEFSFFSILQAGLPGNADWEIGTGPNANTVSNTAQYRYSQSTPGWSDNLDHQFRIGYTHATNTIYATVWGSTGTAYTSQYNPAGGAAVRTDGIWTIDTGALSVSATPHTGTNGQSAPSAIVVDNLQLSAAVNVLQPLSQTSLSASQPAGSGQGANTSPIVFSAAATGGDWYLDGTIRFTGLAGNTAGAGAQRSSLQFGLSGSYTDTPEPAALFLVAGGLGAMAYYRRRRSIV
jgi:hypothetical protein